MSHRTDNSCWTKRNTLNFFAGPGKLPEMVLDRIRDEMKDYRETGMSILEISHRAQPIIDLLDRTQEKIRMLMGLKNDDAVIFLQGGGSLQFLMVPMNLSRMHEAVDYVDTGYWASKAIDAASSLKRDVNIAARDHSAIPQTLDIRTNARYVHICTNNTIVGTQWQTIPEVPVPLVADMSSDILSRKIDFERFSLIYAHAQKTIGSAGVTVVIIPKHTLEMIQPDLPQFLDYRTHVSCMSNYHTPPVFAIYVVECMLDWIEQAIGGLEAMEVINKNKASLLYETLDNSALFYCPVPLKSRSMMNVVFELMDNKAKPIFIREAKNANILGLEGHRSRGGFRASIYNAVTLDDVASLTVFLNDFERRYG